MVSNIFLTQCNKDTLVPCNHITALMCTKHCESFKTQVLHHRAFTSLSFQSIYVCARKGHAKSKLNFLILTHYMYINSHCLLPLSILNVNFQLLFKVHSICGADIAIHCQYIWIRQIISPVSQFYYICLLKFIIHTKLVSIAHKIHHNTENKFPIKCIFPEFINEISLYPKALSI